MGLRDVARVDGGTRGTDGRAERIGELFDEHELLLRRETSAAGDHLRGSPQLRPGGGDLDRFDRSRRGRDDPGRSDVEHLDRVRRHGLGTGVDSALTNRDHRGAERGGRIDQVRPAVDRVVRHDAFVIARDPDGVDRQRTLRAYRETPGDVATGDRVRDEDGIGSHLRSGGLQRVDDRHRERRGIPVGGQHDGCPRRRGLVHGRGTAADDQSHGRADRGGGADEGCRAGRDVAGGVDVDEDEDRVLGRGHLTPACSARGSRRACRRRRPRR